MSGAKVAIIFGFPEVLVPCGHCFLSIFFPFGFRGRRFSVSPCRLGLFSAEVRLHGNGTALHTVYISCCGRFWHYIQCMFHLVGRFEGKNGRQRPENEVGGSIECRLKGVRRLFEAIVCGAGHFSTDGSPLSGLFAYIRAFEGKDRKPDLLFHLKKYGRNERD